MVDSKNGNSDDYIKKYSTNRPQYGKLIWPRFYGLYAIDSQIIRLNYSTTAAIIFLVIFLIIFGIILIQSSILLGLMFLGLGIFSGLWGFIVLYNKRHKNPSLELSSRIWMGAYDWDLFENGILARLYAEERPRKFKEVFFKFKDISKAYININDNNVNAIWDIIRHSKKINVLINDFKLNEENEVLDDLTKDKIKKGLWFVNKNGTLSEFGIEREKLADYKKFVSILRQKIKDVE